MRALLSGVPVRAVGRKIARRGAVGGADRDARRGVTAFSLEGPIWLVGCGNMAGAMLRRWLDCGLNPGEVTVIRKSGEPFSEGVTVLTAPPRDGPVPAMVMLGVKPQLLDLVAPDLAPMLAPE